MTEPYRVFLVLDRDYGQRLAALAQKGPVWIVDTPANRTVAQQIWAANPDRSHLDGITTFKVSDCGSSEDMLINQLDTIDLHHGIYSANPPYTVLDVTGTAITERLKAQLAQFGFDEFRETHEGFCAVRSIPTGVRVVESVVEVRHRHLGRHAQMITREKLQIYEEFGGDIDGWARASKPSEQSITDQDWHLIDEILQSLLIVQSGLASTDFEVRARARLVDAAQDEHVCERLFQLANSKK